MIGKFKIITLCGSTKFKEQFLIEQKRLTLEGNIVISVGLFGHSGDDEVWTENTKEMLDDMHKRKIDLADEIFVINVNGYIGSSTKSEIEYAKSTNKPVKYLVPFKNSIDEYEFFDEIKKYLEAKHEKTHRISSMMVDPITMGLKMAIFEKTNSGVERKFDIIIKDRGEEVKNLFCTQS